VPPTPPYAAVQVAASYLSRPAMFTQVSISTAGSDFNTLVGVYSGDEPEWWDIPLACNGA
jgi:hypothetical protein